MQSEVAVKRKPHSAIDGDIALVADEKESSRVGEGLAEGFLALVVQLDSRR